MAIIDTTTKTIYCVHCDQEIKGDAWYKGKFITFTHAERGNFLCDPLNFKREEHAEPIKP